MAKRKLITRELSIADAVSEAWGELQSLAEEMREAFDNTPESLQSSPAGEARGEAADALENLSEPSVPDSVGGIIVEISSAQVPARRQTRSWRRDEACGLLDTVIERLDEFENNDDAEALRDELDNLKTEAEDVNFPGMYG